MTTQTAYAAFDGEIDAEGGAPDWVHLLPVGPEIVARDGRRWMLSDPQPILEAFAAYNGKLPIDWEHSATDETRKLDRRPAAGWIAELDWRADGMWARVEWSDQGREDIAGLRYRYLSPTFIFHKVTKEIVALTGAGLVNHPAMHLQAIASVQTGGPEMDTEIRQALGLTATAGVADAVAAIAALKTAQATASQFDPTKYALKADHDAALARIAEFEATAAAAEQAALSEAVDAAVAGGKITPASKDQWVTAAASMGLDAFTALMGAQPAIIGSETASASADTPKGRSLGKTEQAIASALGLTPEDFREETA